MRTAIAVALPVLLLTCASAASVVTVDCNGGGDYLTIQEAVDASVAGTLINVSACEYKERVVVPDIALTIQGDGADSTIITWSGAGAAIESGESDLCLRDLSVRHTEDAGFAVRWSDGELTLSGCVVVGRVEGGVYYGEVDISNSSVSSLTVSGGFRTSSIDGSHFGVACFGAPWQTAHTLDSSASSYGTLISGYTLCEGDSIGYIELYGGPDAYNEIHATSTRVDTCVAWNSALVEFDECSVGVLTYHVDSYSWAALAMHGCLVTEEFSVLSEHTRPSAPSRARDVSEGFSVEHNTVLGALVMRPDGWSAAPEHAFRSNIVVGASEVVSEHPITLTNNDFVGGLKLSAPSAEVSDNISEDPLFCEALGGDYTLHEDSPCAGGAHDGTDIGAFGVGCETPVERASWGAIKGMFR